jgi:hypothetical protein
VYWGLRALKVLTAAGLLWLLLAFPRLLSMRWAMEFVPGKGDAVRSDVIGGLAMGGKLLEVAMRAKRSRKWLVGEGWQYELLLMSDGKACQFYGVVWGSRFLGMGRRWGRGCIDW